MLILFVVLLVLNNSECGYIKVKDTFFQTHTTTEKSRHIVQAKLNCANNQKPVAPNLCKTVY